MNRFITLIIAFLTVFSLMGQGKSRQNKEQKKPELPAQVVYAWRTLPPLGMIEPAVPDTTEYNFFQHAIPSEISYAWACTGNLGAEGKNMLIAQQPPISQFFFQDALITWIPTLAKQKFYNSRIPMTIVGYDTGGDRNNGQDRLDVIFNGNINRRAQVGANLDYLYSKGSYNNQAAKGLTWGFNGSYLGDHYEFIGNYNHFNLVNKENGGITDDLYIIDPAQLQGGVSSINPKAIPTNLNNAHTRVVGGELFLANKYKLGFWRDILDEQSDSVIGEEFIPVTAFTWSLQYKHGRHLFLDENKTEAQKFFEHTYLNPDITEDRSNYSVLTNTVGVSMLEGFNKWAKFGLSAFATFETRSFKQTVDTIDRTLPEEAGLDGFPAGILSVLDRKKQNLGWVGAQLSKTQGSILTYEATCQIGFLGDAAGEVKIDGSMSTRIPLLGDTVGVTGYGSLRNTSVPYLLQEYRSNHFIWQNDFGKERRVRFGGILSLPWTGTQLSVMTETLQNYVYFNEQALPAQCGDGIQVFSATLDQRLRLGILHWDNKVTYQTTSNDAVLPLPKLALYSNLYLLCHIATLKLQLGLDCGYYTNYYAPSYQPATATFYNQREMKLGNYPFMTAYANMKLGKCRFYVMMTHVNQGIFGGSNYFSSPHYPLNPRRLQLGLSVDFLN